MNPALEYAGVAFGIIYILLAARNIIWCWPAGIISSALYIYINLFHSLYQDAILQTYYVLAGFYGWWIWQRKSSHPKEEADIVSFNLLQNGGLILLGIVLVPLFGYIFSKLGNSLSYFDATVTVFSFIATWMTAKKILETWIFWVVIDIVATVMYFKKGLHPTVVLYVVYAVVAAYAYYEWRRQMKTA